MSRGWNLAKTDVSTAFLQAKSVDELYIRLPKDLPHEARDMGYVPEGVYKQERAIYGRVDAPRLFTTQFKSALQLHGWGEVAPSILVKRDVKGEIEGVMGTHVDDLLCGAATPCAELEAIGKVYETGDVYAIRQDVYEVYAGLDIMVGKDRCLLGQHRYAEGINTGLNACDALRRRQFTDRDILLTPDGESNIIYKEAQQGWTGILGWLAQTQRQLSVIFSSISRNNTRPSRASVIAAQRACEYAKQTHEDLIFTPIKKPPIELWGDANYDLKECEHCEGRIGWRARVIFRPPVISNRQRHSMEKPSIKAEISVLNGG